MSGDGSFTSISHQSYFGPLPAFALAGERAGRKVSEGDDDVDVVITMLM